MKSYEEIEQEGYEKAKKKKPKMKVSGKSVFILKKSSENKKDK